MGAVLQSVYLLQTKHGSRNTTPTQVLTNNKLYHWAFRHIDTQPPLMGSWFFSINAFTTVFPFSQREKSGHTRHEVCSYLVSAREIHYISIFDTTHSSLYLPIDHATIFLRSSIVFSIGTAH